MVGVCSFQGLDMPRNTLQLSMVWQLHTAPSLMEELVLREQLLRLPQDWENGPPPHSAFLPRGVAVGGELRL